MIRIKHYFFFLGLSLLISGSAVYSQDKVTDSLASTHKQYNLEQCVVEFNIDKSEKTKAGYQYWYSDKNYSDGKTLKMSVVKPGLEVHPPKANGIDEFIFVVEGKGEYYINGVTKAVGPMTSLFYPANAVCGIKNIGDCDLKYLVIRPFGCKK